MLLKQILLTILLCLAPFGASATPIDSLLERIDRGASRKFRIELVRADREFYEVGYRKGKVVVRGNSYVNIAYGIHQYLKNRLGIQLSWNSMHTSLPKVLPPWNENERHETDIKYRYYLNYCTHSYSMAFWDWKRWEQEIDWMALHGINLCLDIVGTDVVWKNVLEQLGYTRSEIDAVIAGPAFQAWWLMNNMEGWGGPNSDAWYAQREALQKNIMKRMSELGVNVCLPGYSGMMPHDARERLGLNVSDPGMWCGYKRPAFLLPTDPRFSEIATLYYKEQQRLYGIANFYSMDPFHEGGSVEGVDLAAAGDAIMREMKRVNPRAVWVVQAWQACPHPEMIRSLKNGDMLVLDLFAESRPQWGDPASTWYRKEGFNGHDWAFCMLLNYGGNVGLFGKLQHLIDEYDKAYHSQFAKTMRGVGLTMEGIENNPVMYELLTDLPWHKWSEGKIDWRDWLDRYIRARYGNIANAKVSEAWHLLATSIYGCSAENVEQGCHESVFCARPSLDVRQVSSWAETTDYYEPDSVIRAAQLMREASAEITHPNDNFRYDLVDICRQANAEKGRLIYNEIVAAYKAKDRQMFRHTTQRFLALLLEQDSLLATMPDFTLKRWIDQARALGTTPAESDHYEWNARTQITIWGNREAAEQGGLREYAHKEWSGVLRDLYYPRWQMFFKALDDTFDGKPMRTFDFYASDEQWTRKKITR